MTTKRLLALSRSSYQRVGAPGIALAIALAAPARGQDAPPAPASEPAPGSTPAPEQTIEVAPEGGPAPELPELPESLSPSRLDEIVVSATRTARSAFDTPAAVTTVDARQIFEQGYRTTPDALRDIPGVMVQKTAYGQGSPFIRGFTGFRTLMLVDGVRLNNSVFRDGPNQYWSTVDPLSLERIELTKGPSSVLYGSDAIGGTVSAFTVSPHSFRGAGVHYDAKVLYRHNTADESNIGRGQLSLGVDDEFGFVFGVSGKHFGDLKAGSPTGVQPNTGYDEHNVDLKAEWLVDDDAKMVVAHQRTRQNNAPRTHQTIYAVPFHGSSVGTDRKQDFDQVRELTYVQLHGGDEGAPIDAFSFNLSWQLQEEDRDRVRGNGQAEKDGFDVGTLGLWGQMSSDTAIGRLTYGVEWWHDNVNSYSTRNAIQGPVADDASYDLLGVYIQDEVDLTDRLGLVVGGRFNYAAASADSVADPETGDRIAIDDDWSDLVGSARLIYQIIPETLNVYGGVSQGFRAPNLSDLTRFDIARTNEIETPQPNLDAEQFLSYEAGVKTQGDWWAATAAYYYTVIDDAIIRAPTGAIIDGRNEVTKLNAGDGWTHGVELGLAVRPHDDWTLFGNMTWMDGELDAFPTSAAMEVTEPLSRLMPLTGQVGVRFDHPERIFWVEGVLLLAAKADQLTTADKADTSRIPPGGTPGYEVFSVRTGWNINRNATFTLALENITDENYRIHGSGINEPGRSLALGLEIRF